MKKLMAIGFSLAMAASSFAELREINGHWVHVYPPKSQAPQVTASSGADITYHGGAVLNAAKVVPIYWGTYWQSGTGANEAATMTSFYEQFGTNKHYQIITQYYDTVTGGTRYIGLSTLTNSGDPWYDATNPSSAKVTDAMVQGEVNRYLSSHAFNDEAVYEVFIGQGYYSNDGSGSSCGGHHLQYCAYHGSYSSGGHTVKYSIEPYPSCSGCQWTGFTTLQNMQHFACHETREAVTDPVNAWWDGTTGYEADDKCAWSPAPFTDGGYGYQEEWSNAVHGCVK